MLRLGPKKTSFQISIIIRNTKLNITKVSWLESTCKNKKAVLPLTDFLCQTLVISDSVWCPRFDPPVLSNAYSTTLLETLCAQGDLQSILRDFPPPWQGESTQPSQLS